MGSMNMNAITRHAGQETSLPLSATEVRVLARVARALLLPLLKGPSQEKALRTLNELARSLDKGIREALAASISSSPLVPKEIAVLLANDLDEIAAPILQYSDVLTEGDLLELTENFDDDAKLYAIACRSEVPDALCLSLVRRGGAEVTVRLARNPGAKFSEETLSEMIDVYASNRRVHEAVIDREALPLRIVTKLIEVIADDLLSRLSARHPLDAATKETILLETNERAVIGLSSGLSSTALARLIRQIAAERRLTSSLLVRAAILGNLEFVVHALAHLNMREVPELRAKILGSPDVEIARLWPIDWDDGHRECIVTAARTIRSVSVESEKWPPSVYRFLVSQRILTAIGGQGLSLADEEIDTIDTLARQMVGSAAELIDPWASKSGRSAIH